MNELIINPHTQEAKTKAQWARVLGYTHTGFKYRLENLPIEEVFIENSRTNARWTREEDAALIEVYAYADFEERWLEYAKVNGFRPRTIFSIRFRANVLRERGLIGTKQDIRDKLGWMTCTQLAFKLVIDRHVISNWIEHGKLPAFKNGKHKNAPIVIKIREFVAWGIGKGAKLLSKSLSSSIIGTQWFYDQVHKINGENFDSDRINSLEKSLSEAEKTIKRMQNSINRLASQKEKLIAKQKEIKARGKAKSEELEAIANPEQLLGAIASICPNSVSEREAYRIAIAQGKDACIKYLKAIRDRRTA